MRMSLSKNASIGTSYMEERKTDYFRDENENKIAKGTREVDRKSRRRNNRPA